MLTIAPHRHCCCPRLENGFLDTGRCGTARHLCGIDSLCRHERLPQIVGRGKSLAFIAGAATKIAFAGLQEFLEALGAAKGVDPFQQFDHRAGAQFQRAVHVAVVACHRDGEVAAVGGNADALAQRAYPLDTLRLVAKMPGP